MFHSFQDHISLSQHAKRRDRRRGQNPGSYITLTRPFGIQSLRHCPYLEVSSQSSASKGSGSRLGGSKDDLLLLKYVTDAPRSGRPPLHSPGTDAALKATIEANKAGLGGEFGDNNTDFLILKNTPVTSPGEPPASADRSAAHYFWNDPSYLDYTAAKA